MNVFDSADLWYPSHRPSIGAPRPMEDDVAADPLWYVVWVLPRPPAEEQAPRAALHVGVGP